MEKCETERAVPPAYTAPVTYQVVKGNKKTLCAVGITVLICTVIFVTTGVVLTANFMRGETSEESKQTPHHYEVNVKINDKTEKEEVEVNPEKKEIVITQRSANAVTMEDFKTGYMVSKEIKKRTCYVMPISENRQADSFDNIYKASEKTNGNVTTQSTIKKQPLMDHVINTEVLRYTAGDSIAGFCAGFDSHWLVDDPGNNREKRQVVYCEYYLVTCCCTPVCDLICYCILEICYYS